MQRQPPLRVVLDTNIALDLFVFDDPGTRALREALNAGELVWLGTAAMHEELRHVLHYPHIEARLQARGLDHAQILQHRASLVTLLEPAARAPVVCKDPDDQKFIDLAFAAQACLISKDQAVLKTARRAWRHGVLVARTLQAVSEKLSEVQRFQ